ncbi:MAG TPA: phage tail tube protein [Xanthobacteraceae bacterium]|nr:phage tail tube protein [Xanthobacteraceae bacterium]
MHISGGRVAITVNGIVYRARGEVSISTAKMTGSVGTNQDGSVYKTMTPKPVSVECSFDRLVDNNGRRVKWDQTMLLANNIGVVVVEMDTGRQHLITNATFVGDPVENVTTGEVTGVSLAGESYEVIER